MTDILYFSLTCARATNKFDCTKMKLKQKYFYIIIVLISQNAIKQHNKSKVAYAHLPRDKSLGNFITAKLIIHCIHIQIIRYIFDCGNRSKSGLTS